MESWTHSGRRLSAGSTRHCGRGRRRFTDVHELEEVREGTLLTTSIILQLVVGLLWPAGAEAAGCVAAACRPALTCVLCCAAAHLLLSFVCCVSNAECHTVVRLTPDGHCLC